VWLYENDNNDVAVSRCAARGDSSTQPHGSGRAAGAQREAHIRRPYRLNEHKCLVRPRDRPPDTFPIPDS
jgi:hypothetical protein